KVKLCLDVIRMLLGKLYQSPLGILLSTGRDVPLHKPMSKIARFRMSFDESNQGLFDAVFVLQRIEGLNPEQLETDIAFPFLSASCEKAQGALGISRHQSLGSGHRQRLDIFGIDLKRRIDKTGSVASIV